MLIGALEAGGTKMVCALGREDGTIIEQVSIPTTTPEETIPKITAYFKDKGIEALISIDNNSDAPILGFTSIPINIVIPSDY